jgi:hypothetical protein
LSLGFVSLACAHSDPTIQIEEGESIATARTRIGRPPRHRMQSLMVSQVDSYLVNALKLWARLYLLIWLAFLQFFVTAFSEIFGVLYLHSVVGLAVLVLAIMNYREIMKTSAPNRVKRISKAIPAMAGLNGVIGIPLYVFTEGTISWAITVLHLAVALAMIAQASSTATAYDMWEEKEFK